MYLEDREVAFEAHPSKARFDRNYFLSPFVFLMIRSESI